MMRFDYPLAARRTRNDLRQGMRDRAEQFQIWLLEGQLAKVCDTVERVPAALADLLHIMANPAANMNVRFGASAVFERYAGTPALKTLVPAFGMLAGHGDARVRADACHILGLSGAPDAMRYLEPRLDDPDAEVREIAAESLDELKSKNIT